jgi:hypothetical protein
MPIMAKVAPPRSRSFTKLRVGSGADSASARARKAMAELTSGILPDKTHSF